MAEDSSSAFFSQQPDRKPEPGTARAPGAPEAGATADPSGGLGPPGGTAGRSGTKETSQETGAKKPYPRRRVFPLSTGWTVSTLKPEGRRLRRGLIPGRSVDILLPRREYGYMCTKTYIVLFTNPDYILKICIKTCFAPFNSSMSKLSRIGSF